MVAGIHPAVDAAAVGAEVAGTENMVDAEIEAFLIEGDAQAAALEDVADDHDGLAGAKEAKA